ncbi:MAG TPA: YceI family protein [Balneolaceae bacterium]|nr:YceI family protein [Balneolaceae bacterium]
MLTTTLTFRQALMSLGISLLLILTTVFQNTNDDVVYYTDSGHAEFTSSVPLHSFAGESNHLTGMIDFRENLVDFYLDLNTLETGIGKRDRDMYQTLNVDEHPFAEFTGTLETPFNPDSSARQVARVTGEFSINGVVKEVSIEGTLQARGERIMLNVGWELRLEDYDIEAPGILFYRVDEVQSIQIEGSLKPVDPETISG